MRILYIDLDSCRPDHLGCYGYHRDSSPTIDQIASEGIVFDHCYTSDAPCLPSRSALYSGRFGIQTGIVGHGGTAAKPKIEGPRMGFMDCFNKYGLAKQLQDIGFKTAMISSFGQRHSAWHFYAGFNEIVNSGQNGMESAHEVELLADKWLKDNATTDNWYLHLNFWDAHTPYRVPEDYGNPFDQEPLPEWLDSQDLIQKHNQFTGPHTSMEVRMYDDIEDKRYPRQPGKVVDLQSMRKLIDGYDTAIRYIDDKIARLITHLKKIGVYEDTMIIISADHGENLGELGIYAEHGTADEATCRIPLIIRFPGGVNGYRNDKFHYNVDLLPTLMDLLGGERFPIWDGESYAPAITEGLNIGRDEVIISQCAHVCQRAVRWDKWLYIRTYHDGFRLFAQEMLFDLDKDPHEQCDIADKFGDLCTLGQWKLSRWHDQQMHKMIGYSNDVVDPLWTVVREGGPFHASLTHGQPGPEGFRKYLQHLRSTGRQQGANLLDSKHGTFV